MHRIFTISGNLKEKQRRKYNAYVMFCRVWGIATSIIVLGIGVDEVHQTLYMGIYLLCVGFVLTLLEYSFLIDAFIDLYISIRRGVCCKLWNAILWLDCWRRGVIYLVLSVACFTKPIQAWLATIAGSCVLISSMLYIMKGYLKRQLDHPLAERVATADTSSCSDMDDSDVPEEFTVRLEDFDSRLPPPEPDRGRGGGGGAMLDVHDILLDDDDDEENVPIMTCNGSGGGGGGGARRNDGRAGTGSVWGQRHVIDA